MALTVPRWIVAAIAGCLILGAYLLRPVPERVRATDEWQRLQQRVGRTRSDGARAAERLYTLRLRDSLLLSLKRTRAPDSSRVFFGAGVEGRLRNALGSLIVRLASDRPARAKVPVDVFFVLDEMALMHGVRRDYRDRPVYLLPSSSNPRCVILFPAQSRSSEWFGDLNPYYGLSSNNRMREFIGPCAFYERFGAPGENVKRWLHAGGWSLGAVSSWSRSSPPWKTPWYERTSAMLRTSPYLRAAGWPLRDYIGTTGYRCVSGDSVRCRDIVLGATDDLAFRPARVTWSTGIVSDDYRFYNRWALGPNQNALLAEMVRSLGPESFQRFWTSPLPPAEAFRAATGQDIGSWTLDWARRMYGEQTRGPGLSEFAAGVGILVALAALGAAMAAAQQRQVA